MNVNIRYMKGDLDRMGENRLYVDGKLKMINYSEYATLVNYDTLVEQYGEEHVKLVRLSMVRNDEEKSKWLNEFLGR